MKYACKKKKSPWIGALGPFEVADYESYWLQFSSYKFYDEGSDF